MAFSTISNFLFLRIKQATRIISNMGIGVLIILPFIILLLMNAYNFFLKNPIIIFQSLLALIILTIHTKRKDKKFLKVFKLNGVIVLHFEYFLIISTLNIPFMVKNGVDAIMIASYFVSSMIVFGDKLINTNFTTQFNLIKKITSVFPIDTYEWKVGIRKNRILFGISYVLGLLLLPFAPVTPFFIFYWCMFSGEFYKENENKEIIQSYNKTNTFLRHKLKSLIILLNVIFSPHYILFIIWNFTVINIVILLASILLMNLIFTYALLLKYSLVDFRKRTIDNTVSLTIFLIISPILFLSLPLEWRTFTKAKWNIQKLLK
jgi:hypothetical protein